MFGVPLGELAVLAVLIVVGGVVTGFLAGIFGVGGGAVIVPVLYEIFRVLEVPEEVRMQLCVGTSLAIIVPTTLRSFLAHKSYGQMPLDVMKRWAVPVIIGMLSGAAVAGFAPAWVFRLAFVVFACIVAIPIFFGLSDRGWRLGETLPGQPTMSIYGLLLGGYAAFMGVGGGAMTTLILRLYGINIHTAIGLSAGVGIIIAGTGTVGFALAGLPHQELMPPLSIGYISLIGFLLMTPITAAIAPYGAKIAHRLPRRRLEILFGCFLIAVALRFGISLF